MTLDRQDLDPEGNEARRKFWERCASRQPQCIFAEIGDSGTHYFTVEDPNSIAQWADHMLIEWDKRWIARETETSQEGKTVLPFSIPDLVNKFEEVSDGGSLSSNWVKDRICDLLEEIKE